MPHEFNNENNPYSLRTRRYEGAIAYGIIPASATINTGFVNIRPIN